MITEGDTKQIETEEQEPPKPKSRLVAELKRLSTSYNPEAKEQLENLSIAMNGSLYMIYHAMTHINWVSKIVRMGSAASAPQQVANQYFATTKP